MRPVGPDRRTFLTLGVGALAMAALPTSLRRTRTLVRRRIPVMGTVAEVAVPGPDGASAQRAIDAALAALRRVEAAMTRFRPDSDVGKLNTSGGRWTPVGEETALVLARARRWAAISEGGFDPCLGRATALWDPTSHRVPPPDEALEVLADAALWEVLEVEGHGGVRRARLASSGAAVDLGGIAKGYGVDAAADALRRHGYVDGLVNVGGDLVALGVDADDGPWRVGIRSPDDPEGIAGVVDVSDAAVATSGDYLRFFEHGGRRYHHLLDPRTGRPVRTPTRSLTVRADRCMDADAAATALFGATDTDERVLARAGGDVRVIHRIRETTS